jgi:pimeloyl-ACP methyl ester carboxylesterase
VNIAYQVTGDGPVDLVYLASYVPHIDHEWEEPSYRHFLERIASFSRLIRLDRRGTGLSDPVDDLPTLEDRMDDVRAVMDAVGVERAVLVGISEAGPMTTLFAATYPERTRALVLCNSFARNQYAPDYPWALDEAQWERFLRTLEELWGTGITARLYAPSRADDEDWVRAWGRFERHAASPGAMRRIFAMAKDTDVREVLSSMRVPTLVLHRTGDLTPVEGSRYLAEHIPGAKLVEVPGRDHFPWVGDSDAILDAIEHFVTGARPSATPDRILATMLFIDIVDSTRQLAERGDRRWSELLERFYATLHLQLERFRGRAVDTAGDGVFATFDGPARAIRCACAIRDAVESMGLSIRAGLHTGECEVRGDKVSGIAVHLGARVMSTADPGEVLVSNTVKDLVAGSSLRFAERGVHALKGIPGDRQLYAAEVN